MSTISCPCDPDGDVNRGRPACPRCQPETFKPANITMAELYEFSTQVAAGLGVTLTHDRISLLMRAAGRLSGYGDKETAYNRMREAVQVLADHAKGE